MVWLIPVVLGGVEAYFFLGKKVHVVETVDRRMGLGQAV